MGILTLNPSSFYPYGRGSWTTVGVSGPSALSDGVDTTYIRLSSNYTGTGKGASWKVRVGSGQLPGGAKVEWMRAVVRARTTLATGAGSEAYFRTMIQNIRGGNPLGINTPFTSGNKKVTTSWTNIYNEIEKTTMSNGKYYGDGSITQADLGSLVIEFYEIVTPKIEISKAWAEISYDEKPVVAINDPGTIGETTSPVITFDYSDDKMPLDSVDVEVLDSNGNLIHSAEKVPSASPSYGIPISLDDGDYKVRIRAWQQWNYVGEAPVSDWDEADFTIAIGRPAQPEFTVTEEPALGRVKLTVKSNLNLLPNDAAEGMPAAWNSTVNARVETGETFQDTAGDRSLLMEVISGGTGYMKAFSVPLIPVKPNVYYTFGFNARAYTGDTLSNVQAGVRWLDADGDQIGADSFGAQFMEISGQWKPVYHNTQAPADAAYATPFITVNSSQTNGWHYIDALQFVAQANFAEPLPAWSRGGFANLDSANLLSYGDSTFEGSSHWTAVAAEAGSKEASVSVVNVFSETNDNMYSYQGDNMLKIATVDTLIKRDVEPAFSTGTAINIPKGDTQDGDYMLVQITVQGTATVATPAGWTLLNTTAAGTSHRIYAFGKFHNGEGATLSFTASASGKHGANLISWTGIDPTTPLDSIVVSTVQSGTSFTVPTSSVPHNAPVIQSAWGRRVASTVATSFSSNLGGNYDTLLSTTANTAAEVAAGVFSRRYDTGTTTPLSLTGRTITCANSLTDVLTVSVVLRPDKSTVRASLREYEYYEFDSTKTYTVHAALMGSAGNFGPNSANRAIGFLVDVYDNDKNFINGYYAYQGVAVPGTWVKMSNTINVPDNPAIKYATIRIEIDQISDYEAYYIDAVSLYQSSTNLGYIEGFKQYEGPYIQGEYSEDDGETWKTADDTGSQWLKQEVSDFSDATIEFLDYEIASETPRLYRFYNWKIEEGNLIQSDYSAVQEAEIKLRRVWLHTANDPEGTIYHFLYDGSSGRDDEFNKLGTVLQFAGREYGQVHFGETKERVINTTVQLPTGEDILALQKLDRSTGLVIFRDGRGRRVKGLLTVKFSDVKWGATANISVQVLGLQP